MLDGDVVSRGRCDATAEVVPLFTLKDLLWFLYLYPFRVFSKLASRGLLYQIGKLGEPLVQFRSRERRKTAARRMLAATGSGITPDQAPQIARRFVSNATFRVLDDLILNRSSFQRILRCRGVEGLEHLEGGKSAGRGVVVLTAHFYASRIAKRYLATIGYPMLSVRNKQPPDDLAGQLGRRILQSRYMEFLHGVIQDEVYVQDSECTLKILQRLRSGGLVNIHFDAPYGARSVEWPFLGKPERFATGIFDIVRLSGCAVAPMVCLGRSTEFRIGFGPLLEIVPADTRDEFVSANLPSFVQTLEKHIVDHPDEWELWTRL